MHVRLLAIVVSLATAASPVLATTHHVAPDGSGDFATIQAAIDAAASGDEIVLADGTFTGDGNWDLDLGTKELVLRSENGYEFTFLEGDFICVEWTPLRRAISVGGGQGGATRIEGVTIQRFLTGSGVIHCESSSPTIRNVRFRLNHGWEELPGLGIVAVGGSLTVEDCVFEANGCEHQGRKGIGVLAHESWVTIARCSFDHNIGSSIVDIDGGRVTDCSFVGTNSAFDYQGVCLNIANGDVTVQRCTFRQTFGCGVRVSTGAEVLIGSCLFEDNTGDDGPAVSNSGNTTVRNSTFRHNQAGFYGSAIATGTGALALDHCVFADNTAFGVLGFGGSNGTVSVWGASADIDHCTFVRSRGSLCGSAVELWYGAHVTLAHSIIAFGGPETIDAGALYCGTPDVTLEVSCTDIFGNQSGDWVGCVAGMELENGNLSSDPKFCDVTRDFSLQEDSPCAPGQTGECGLIGALGPWCGPLAVEPHSWGSIKALYR